MPADLPERLAVYSNLVLAAMSDEDDDPLWQRFYRIQIASFFLSKKNLRFKLEEACRAYRMIVNRWCDVKTDIEDCDIPIRNIDNLFKTILIDYPYDCEEECKAVSTVPVSF